VKPCDRRKRPRARCRNLSVLVGEGRVVSVEIRNISEEGVGLASQDPIPEKAVLQLTIPGATVGLPIEKVHAAEAVQGAHVTGARFVDAGGDPVLLDYVRRALRAC